MGFWSEIMRRIESDQNAPKWLKQMHYSLKNLEQKKHSKRPTYKLAIKLVGKHQPIPQEYIHIHQVSHIPWERLDMLYASHLEIGGVFCVNLRGLIRSFLIALAPHLRENERLMAIYDSFMHLPEPYIHKDKDRAEFICKKHIMLKSYMLENLNALQNSLSQILLEYKHTLEQARIQQGVKEYFKHYYNAQLQM
ncbi:hypothetical protein [Helicobacter labetoulli]|uniref:hypothetical protein n=1 Tax=Helicobacter labetoulli TaxID=2315333 RepID=UPI000EF6AC3B|nr:hypothetical protein [Helicobacter labetoulli]